MSGLHRSRDTVKGIRDACLGLEQQNEQDLTSNHSSLGGFGDRRACLRLGAGIAHRTAARSPLPASGGFRRRRFVDKGALGGNSFDDILGGQYRRHPDTTFKRTTPCFHKLWFKPL